MANGAGLVDHVWSRPGGEEPVLKLAFVKRFAPWGWLIGTGSPIDENEARFRADAFALLQLGLAIGGFIAARLLLLSRHILRTLGGEPFAEESLRTAVLQFGSVHACLPAPSLYRASRLPTCSPFPETYLTIVRP